MNLHIHCTLNSTKRVEARFGPLKIAKKKKNELMYKISLLWRGLFEIVKKTSIFPKCRPCSLCRRTIEIWPRNVAKCIDTRYFRLFHDTWRFTANSSSSEIIEIIRTQLVKNINSYLVLQYEYLKSVRKVIFREKEKWIPFDFSMDLCWVCNGTWKKEYVTTIWQRCTAFRSRSYLPVSWDYFVVPFRRVFSIVQCGGER